jgi:glutathione peroxidase
MKRSAGGYWLTRQKLTLLGIVILLWFGVWYIFMRGKVGVGSDQTVYGFTVRDIDGNEFKLDRFRSHVMLIVNVASEWGKTKRDYPQLQTLYNKYKDKGFVVLAFPCNQFGEQEPNPDEEIKKQVTQKFGVTFPLMSKIDVNGPKAHPLFKFLKKQLGGGDIKWNFEKFLIDKSGVPVKRYSTEVAPLDIEKDILTLFD